MRNANQNVHLHTFESCPLSLHKTSYPGLGGKTLLCICSQNGFEIYSIEIQKYSVEIQKYSREIQKYSRVGKASPHIPA